MPRTEYLVSYYIFQFQVTKTGLAEKDARKKKQQIFAGSSFATRNVIKVCSFFVEKVSGQVAQQSITRPNNEIYVQ